MLYVQHAAKSPRLRSRPPSPHRKVSGSHRHGLTVGWGRGVAADERCTPCALKLSALAARYLAADERPLTCCQLMHAGRAARYLEVDLRSGGRVEPALRPRCARSQATTRPPPSTFQVLFKTCRWCVVMQCQQRRAGRGVSRPELSNLASPAPAHTGRLLGPTLAEECG